MIVARLHTILDQSEREYLYNQLRNNMKPRWRFCFSQTSICPYRFRKKDDSKRAFTFLILITALWKPVPKTFRYKFYITPLLDRYFHDLAFFGNPLNPKSYQHLNSPNSNTTEMFIKITRMKKMITNLGFFNLIIKFSFSVPKEKYREEYGEYEYWCWGVKGLKGYKRNVCRGLQNLSGGFRAILTYQKLNIWAIKNFMTSRRALWFENYRKMIFLFKRKKFSPILKYFPYPITGILWPKC